MRAEKITKENEVETTLLDTLYLDNCSANKEVDILILPFASELRLL